jgi:hypothetical protein
MEENEAQKLSLSFICHVAIIKKGGRRDEHSDALKTSYPKSNVVDSQF